VIFLQYKRAKTKDNVNFEDPLSELIAFKVSLKEKEQFEAIARENEISVSELFRNLARENIHNYAISEDLRMTLCISNKIESIVLKARIISSRKPSNLSHLREFFSDFEAFLDEKASNISDSEFKNKLSDFNELKKIIILNDPWLFSKLKPQLNRIIKNKRFKELSLKVVNC
jgi:hypothetical protein